MNPDVLIRAVALGASTGGRTFTGLATLTATTPAGAATQPDAVLGKTWVKCVVAAVAVQELVGDKLPQAPSRTDALPLGGRLVAGAAGGALVARRFGEPSDAGDPVTPRPVVDPDAQRRQQRIDALVGAVVSATAVAGTSWLGPRVRAWCAAKLGHDWIAAVFEDGLAAGLAAFAARPRSSSTG